MFVNVISENGIGFQNVDKKCRLCLGYKKFLIYLYEASGMPKNVAKAISELLNYKVSEMDGFPPYICTACSDKLWEFKAFKYKCNSAFEILLKERERRSENSSSFMNAIPVKEEPVVNDSNSSHCRRDGYNTKLQMNAIAVKEEPLVEDFTSSQCNTDTAHTELQVFVESISVKQEEPVSCPANQIPNTMKEHQYKVPEGVLQPRKSSNSQLNQSESLKCDMVYFVPYSNMQDDNEVFRSKTYNKASSNQEVQSEKIYPEKIGIVARDAAILNDHNTGFLHSLLAKTSASEVRSEKLNEMRDAAILNDHNTGFLQSLLAKTSASEVRSEKLNEMILLRNYGVNNRQTVILSNNIDRSSGDEIIEISSSEEDLVSKISSGDDVIIETSILEGKTSEDLYLESFLSADHIPGLEHIHDELKKFICKMVIYVSSNLQFRQSDKLKDNLQSTGYHQPHSSSDKISKFTAEGTTSYERWLEGFLSLDDVKQTRSLPDKMRTAKRMRTSSRDNSLFIEMKEKIKNTFQQGNKFK